MYPERLQALIGALKRLPGVGPKSAQRIAFHLLDQDRAAMGKLAAALEAADTGLRQCKRCRNYSESELCPICQSADLGRRDRSLLCVVESVSDLVAIEQGADFNGVYFVLHGRLSPLDGIGPDALGFDALAQQLADPQLAELILATSSTVEGEATAHYITQLAKQHGKRVSRIAQGVPMGGELEFVDSSTLAHAFAGRGAV